MSVVSEVMRPLALQSRSHVPGYVLGLAIVRGEATPVVDLSALLCGVPSSRATRWLSMVGQGGGRTRRIAAAADEVIGVRDRGDLAISSPAPLLRDADAGMLAELGQLDGELLSILRSGLHVPDSACTGPDGDGG